MATRLIGTDSANPRLPTVVITATQGYTRADLAPGDVLADAKTYTDDAVADIVAGGVNFADNTETLAGTATAMAVTPAGLAYERPYVDVRSHGAIGDGVTDDTTALQAALTAAGTSKVVFVPPGTYQISATLTAQGRVVGSGIAQTKIRQSATNHGILDFNTCSDWEVSDLTLEGTGSPRTNHRLLLIRGDGSGGCVRRVKIIGGGLYIHGGASTFDPEPATVQGKQRRCVLDSVLSQSATEFGICLTSMQGVDLLNPQITSSAYDGIKLEHDCDDVTITGGFATLCGEEGIDSFMGGMNLTIQGFKAFDNTGNGITIKTDENVWSPGNYMPVGQTSLIGLIMRDNGGYGLTIDRQGGVDDPTNWLLSHAVVVGGVFERNTFGGIKVRARNISLVGVICRNNGQQGIQVMPETLDCDIISPQVSGNSQTTVNTYDGIVVAGTRVRVIGGFSIGKDAYSIKNDGDYAALTAQQRYGAVIQGGSTDCSVFDCIAFGNATGDINTFGTRGMLRTRNRWDLLDAGATVRNISMESTGKLVIPGLHTSGEAEIDGPLNHDGTTVGFYNVTPVARAASPGTATGTDAAVINAIVTALRNVGLVT